MARRYWIGTIPESIPWSPPESLHGNLCWLKGQKEQGEGGLVHWQVVAAFTKAVRLATVKREVSPGHWEPTRSKALEEYVWKEETRIDGTQFERGKKAHKRGDSTDWVSVLEQAKSGVFENLPEDVQVRYWNNLRSISCFYSTPSMRDVTTMVFWGRIGTGKSKRAFQEAGMECYIKDPASKWWCGYRGQRNVVLDEFRGQINISHLLRWLDRYPVMVEVKGSQIALKAERFWITSNKNPRDWYDGLDNETREALIRRLNITHYI